MNVIETLVAVYAVLLLAYGPVVFIGAFWLLVMFLTRGKGE